MSNSFSVTVPGSIDTAIAMAKTAITTEGGSFMGDNQSGQFTGTSPIGDVKGNYTVAGNVVNITITEKPFLAPMSLIEQKIRDFFKPAP
jgi:hypothetical protein